MNIVVTYEKGDEDWENFDPVVYYSEKDTNAMDQRLAIELHSWFLKSLARRKKFDLQAIMHEIAIKLLKTKWVRAP